jgi:hypothetical protein
MSKEPINPWAYAAKGLEAGMQNRQLAAQQKSEAELQGMRRNEYARKIMQFNQEQQALREAEAEKARQAQAMQEFMSTLEPEEARMAAVLGPDYAKQIMQQRVQRPTSLQQNLIAAGLKPGTPEFQQAMMTAALGGDQPAGVQEFLFNQKNPEYMKFRQRMASLSPEAQAAAAYGKAFQSETGRAEGGYASRASAAETARVIQEGAEAGRGDARSRQERQEKMPVLGAVNYLAQQFLGDPTTNTPGAIDKLYSGGFMGAKSKIAPVVDRQDRDNFESLQKQLSTQLRAIFRIPGEGTLSDREQADNNLMLPSVQYDPSTNKTIMKNLLEIINIRTSQAPEALPTDSQVTQYPRGTVRERGR